MSDDIVVERHGYVQLVIISRPEKMNSLDFAAHERLIEIWRQFDADEQARVAVLTGTGDQAFCAGADLKTYTMDYARRPAPEFRLEYTNGPGLGGITRGMEVCKPIIAAINGYAVSGGLELALACDIRFCSPNAEFGFQDVRWGFHPCDGGCVRLPLIVGLGNAMELILSGDRIDADHALRIGLVNQIYPQDQLLEETLAYAEGLARRAPLAQRFAKEVILRSLGRPMDEGLKLESRSFHDLAQCASLRNVASLHHARRGIRRLPRGHGIELESSNQLTMLKKPFRKFMAPLALAPDDLPRGIEAPLARRQRVPLSRSRAQAHPKMKKGIGLLQ